MDLLKLAKSMLIFSSSTPTIVYSFSTDSFLVKAPTKGIKNFSRDDLNHAFEALLKREQIDKLGILAYRVGTRYAMNLCLMHPDRISLIHLFAPDGLVLNFWNRAMAYSSLGRASYNFLMRNHRLFVSILDLGARLGLLRSCLVKFAKLHTRSHEDQERVLRLWVLLKDVQPDYEEFVRVVNQNRIPLSFAFGKYDSVITKRVQRKAKRLSPFSSCVVLSKGHKLSTREAFLEWQKTQTS